jgi:hypothetical protein
MTQRNEPKIKVLETETLELCEHESVELPSRIEINGSLFKAEVERCPCGCDAVGSVVTNENGSSLSLKQLLNLKLGDIPDLVNIKCEAPEPLGQLRLYPTGFGVLEVFESVKYYRGYLPIHSFFEALKRVASKNGFKIINDEVGDDHYFLLIGKKFPKDTSISQVYKATQPLATKIKELEAEAEEAIKSILKSIEG